METRTLDTSNHLELDTVLRKIQKMVANSPTTPVSSAADRSTEAPFKVLMATIISLRTKDAVTAEAAKRLFELADNPETMLRLTSQQIARAIYPAGFYKRKSEQILECCRILQKKHQGKVPPKQTQLLELPGVGLKTANLVLARGYNIPSICVDTHVHRICNRLGWVNTKHPDKTEQELTKIVPEEWWIEINEIMVHFGQQICTPLSPRCSRCTLDSSCPKPGITRSR